MSYCCLCYDGLEDNAHRRLEEEQGCSVGTDEHAHVTTGDWSGCTADSAQTDSEYGVAVERVKVVNSCTDMYGEFILHSVQSNALQTGTQTSRLLIKKQTIFRLTFPTNDNDTVLSTDLAMKL